MTPPTSDLDLAGVFRRETCSLAVVRRVAALLDLDPDGWREDDLLPRGWHFVLLGADTRRSDLRGDGFPGLGVPLPDLGLPRLVLGGRTVAFAGDVAVGESLDRRSRVASVSRKDRLTGSMAVVEIGHALARPTTREPVLTETQTYMLFPAEPGTRDSSHRAAAAVPLATKQVVPDDTMLFQFSALGFNSHRIHLDRAYARDVEGFPDLVVNGGLVTLLLTDFLRTDLRATPATMSARHLAPLFCNRPVTLGGERTPSGWQLRAFDDTGRLAVELDVRT